MWQNSGKKSECIALMQRYFFLINALLSFNGRLTKLGQPKNFGMGTYGSSSEGVNKCG